MRKINKTGVLWICAVIGFIVTLYMVEASSFGSAAVAVHNEGYGTFDMKKYDYASVTDVLANMDSEGIRVYQKYYFADFLFIICFGLIQCMISSAVYKKNKLIYRRIAIGVPIARGIFDVIENVLLFITITNYPKVSNGLIMIASISTQCKLWCIRIWVVMLLIGIVYNICKKKVKSSCASQGLLLE